MRFRRGDGREKQAPLQMRGGQLDFFAGLVRSAADELNATVDDHLRSVDAAVREGGGVGFLAASEVGRGERIAPAEVIPIVNVLFESDDFGSVDGLLLGQLFEERIGRRATGAAFGSEEFDEDRLRGSGPRKRGIRARVCGRASEERNKHRGQSKENSGNEK